MVERVFRGVTLLAAWGVLAVVGACAAPEVPPTTPPRASVPVGTGGVSTMDCDDQALLQAPAEALTVLADVPGTEWTARPASESLPDLVLVAMSAEPDGAGDSDHRFVYRCDPGGPSYVGVYVLDGEVLVLLATSDSLGQTELPPELVRTASD